MTKYFNYIMFFVFEQLTKDMHKLFALGCMGQSDVNGINPKFSKIGKVVISYPMCSKNT